MQRERAWRPPSVKDRKLSENEFSQFLSKSEKFKNNTDLIKKPFAMLDANNDKFLTLDEFKKITEMCGEAGAMNEKKQPDATTRSVEKEIVA
jgi:Ca2+-binding EF-hand superfamily protein